MLPPNNKNEIIDAIHDWANKAEQKENMDDAIKAAHGVQKLKLQLSKTFYEYTQTDSSFVKATPLKVGTLVSHFNAENELLYQTENIKTHNQAVSTRSGMFEGDPKLCFRIAHIGGTQYLCAKTPDHDDIIDARNVERLNNQSELKAYLRREMPDGFTLRR